MINIADQSNKEVSSELMEKEMKIVRSAYATADSEENLVVKIEIH